MDTATVITHGHADRIYHGTQPATYQQHTLISEAARHGLWAAKDLIPKDTQP